MQAEQPSSFLIIKEPPFPASYNRETYLARTLGEMSPGYSYAEYKSRLSFLVRKLPASPDEGLILSHHYAPASSCANGRLRSLVESVRPFGCRREKRKSWTVNLEQYWPLPSSA